MGIINRRNSKTLVCIFVVAAVFTAKIFIMNYAAEKKIEEKNSEIESTLQSIHIKSIHRAGVIRNNCYKYEIPQRMDKQSSFYQNCTSDKCNLITNTRSAGMFCLIPEVGMETLIKDFIKFSEIEEDKIKIPQSTNMDSLKEWDAFWDRYRSFDRCTPNGMIRNYWRKFYKILFVRDPILRIISVYVKLVENNLSHPLVELLNKDSSQDSKSVTFPMFIQYLIETPFEQMEHNWQPYFYLCDVCQMPYKYVGTYETINQDRFYLYNRFKIEFKNETSEFHTEDRHKELLTQLSKKQLMDFFRKYRYDFILFGYTIHPHIKLLDGS